MEKLNKFLLLILLSIVTPTVAFANCSPKINRTLTIGTKGEDVKTLQKFLNENPATVISKTGINSKGKENGVFDSATLKAFKIFQQKNSSEILKPAGLTTPNGVVGLNSRKIINDALCSEEYDLLYSSSTIPDSINRIKSSSLEIDAKMAEIQSKLNSNREMHKRLMSKIENLRLSINRITGGAMTIEDLVKKVSAELNKTPLTQTELKKVELSSILPNEINVGDKIYLIGRNFQLVNKLHIGNNILVANKASSTDNYIVLYLPQYIKNGNYDAYIENSIGVSEKIKINIGNTGGEVVLKPEITSVTPNKGNIGTDITINGKNFTKSNTIYTTTKSFTGVPSSDGNTLKFKLSAEPNMLLGSGKLMTTLPFSIFVRNENGDSNYINLTLE